MSPAGYWKEKKDEEVRIRYMKTQTVLKENEYEVLFAHSLECEEPHCLDSLFSGVSLGRLVYLTAALAHLWDALFHSSRG